MTPEQIEAVFTGIALVVLCAGFAVVLVKIVGSDG